jgi:hypothetical protein
MSGYDYNWLKSWKHTPNFFGNMDYDHFKNIVVSSATVEDWALLKNWLNSPDCILQHGNFYLQMQKAPAHACRKKDGVQRLWGVPSYTMKENKNKYSIYYDARTVAVSFLFFVFLLVLYFHKSNFEDGLLLVGSIIFLSLTIVYQFVPIWSYDSRGFWKKNLFGSYSCGWADIDKVVITGLLDGFYIRTRDKKYFSLQYLITADYVRHAQRVIGFVENQREGVEFPKNFTDRIKKLKFRHSGNKAVLLFFLFSSLGSNCLRIF